MARNDLVKVSLTADEKGIAVEIAKAEGLAVATYFRQLLHRDYLLRSGTFNLSGDLPGNLMRSSENKE